MDEQVAEWRKAGKYLPRFMRDFHDQKDLFKAMHDLIAVDKHDYAKRVDWIAGQCYVVDIFLWHMARHGYVLRKSAVKLPFDDIDVTTTEANERARNLMARAMGLTPIDAI